MKDLKLLILYCCAVFFILNSCLIKKTSQHHSVDKYSKEYFKKNDSIFEIIETQSGRKFAIGGHYIFDFSNQKKYVYPETKNAYYRYLKNNKNGIHEEYSLVKTDNSNRVWVLMDYHEFGGGIYVFNTNKNEYEIIPTNHLSKLFSIPDSAFYFLHFNPLEMYENEHGIYIYSYVNHMSNCTSILYHFNGLKPEIELIKTNGNYENVDIFDNFIHVHHPDSCKITDLESYIGTRHKEKVN